MIHQVIDMSGFAETCSKESMTHCEYFLQILSEPIDRKSNDLQTITRSSASLPLFALFHRNHLRLFSLLFISFQTHMETPYLEQAR